MFYRVKQFMNGLLAKITPEDIDFINLYLSSSEKKLFSQLRTSEQYHSLQVAYGCRNEAPENSDLIKAALLHDIGKIGTNLTLINKSFVILSKKFKVKEDNLPPFLQKAMEEQIAHPKRSYELLKALEVKESILNIVLNHHSDPRGNQDLALLQKYDDMF